MGKRVKAAFSIRPSMGRLDETSAVAAAVLYLASPASGHTTGAIFSIDRGYTA